MAAVTQGDIKFKIEFDRANVDGPIFKFTDQTIYEDPSAVKGAIRVEYNGVVLWDNLSNIETDPDIDGNSAGQVNGTLTRANTQPTPLSLPLAYNDTIVNGEYTITYSLRESGESVITNTVTLDYLFELPEGSISSLVDLTLTSPSITVVDNTNYTYNNITPTGIPTLKLYYPADVDLPEVSVEASQLIVTSFYTGSQVGVLEASKVWNYSPLISDTTFTIGNVTVYSNDVVTDRINIPVEANGDICTIFCCMKDFGARLYQAKSSPTKYAQLSAIAGQVAFYFSSITAAYECGKTENINLWVNEIRSLVDCNEDCDCDGATPILISPINGETVGYSLSVNDGSTDVSNVTEISFQGASVTNDENGQVTVTVENSPTLTVTDGVTTVNTVDNITFTGATVTDDGSGDVTVAITGGGGGAVDSVNGETGAVVLTTGDIAEDTDANYVTDAQLVVIGDTSGTNTGDQDLSGLVPYTGATQNVDLGEFQIDAGQVTFDQTPTQAAGVGVLRWNDNDGTLDLGLKGGNVTLQVGQEEVIRIVNKTDADLLESDFRAVRIRTVAEGGAQGQRLAVVLAQANSDINSATTIGLVTENITNNREGFVTTAGNVNGIDTTGAKSFTGTEDWQDGDVVYLDPDNAGYLTNIKPITPAHLIVIGYVEYAHVNGKIYVKVDNGYELEELHDVLITSVADNELLQYNSAGGYWENQTLAEAGIQPSGSYLASGDNVSELTNDAGYLTSAPVDSVAGKIGVVTLVKADISDFSDADYATAAQGALADSATQPSDNVSTLTNDSNYLPSNPTGVTGADIVTNIMSLTQAEYDVIVTPNASTLYIING